MAVTETLKRTAEGVIHQIQGEDGPAVGISLTFEQIKELIKAAKAPDDETVRLKAEAEARRQEQMTQMIAIAKIEEETRRNSQDRCGHKKSDQSSTIYGQIHSDRKIHPICVRCQKLFAPYDPPMELVAGMGIG